MEASVQIFTGGFNGPAENFDAVKAALGRVINQPCIRRIIMGWAPNPVLYERAREFTYGRAELWLWLPVFAETGLLRPNAPLIGIHGNKIEGHGHDARENFEFCCPSSPVNADHALDIFGGSFPPGCFDGVFLDKIRYPSFAYGLGDALTCFCPRCEDAYARAGIDAGKLRSKASALPDSAEPFGMAGYANGAYAFKDELWDAFFKLKASLALDGVKAVCKPLRAMGLGIGMDVFAPFLSAFVGQDIPSLSELCDFIKPMMYRATNAPAGLPFELGAFLHEAGGYEALARILRLDPSKHPFDLDFCSGELRSLRKVSRCPVYAGMEINRIKGLADVRPPYIRETIGAYCSAGVEGIALSWDILRAPEENLRAALKAVELCV